MHTLRAHTGFYLPFNVSLPTNFKPDLGLSKKLEDCNSVDQAWRVEALISYFDNNTDSKVTLDEYLLHIASFAYVLDVFKFKDRVNQTSAVNKTRLDFFAFLDVNSNGELDQREFDIDNDGCVRNIYDPDKFDWTQAQIVLQGGELVKKQMAPEDIFKAFRYRCACVNVCVCQFK
jgi:hypothetical protein